MSDLAERTLFCNLTDPDEVGVLAREGLGTDYECLPSEELRPVVAWAVRYYLDADRRRAPSIEAFTTTWGQVLEDHDIQVGNPDDDEVDTMAWAIEVLKADYARYEGEKFTSRFVTNLSQASTEDKATAVAQGASELVRLAMSLEPRQNATDAREGMREILADYRRQASGEEGDGLTLGFSELDAYFGRLHNGELAVLAGPTGIGKSFWLDLIALRAWEEGQSPALITLELSRRMMLERIACMATHVSAEGWRQKTLDPEELGEVEAFVDKLEASDHPLWILRPEPGQRRMEHLVALARAHAADSILIDQLSYVEAPDPRRPKPEQLGQMMHTLQTLVTGRANIPAVIAHQINRKGNEEARKDGGKLRHEHLADSSEVERTPDIVLGMWQGEEQADYQQLTLQTMKFRGGVPGQWWDVNWDVEHGIFAVESARA